MNENIGRGTGIGTLIPTYMYTQSINFGGICHSSALATLCYLSNINLVLELPSSCPRCGEYGGAIAIGVIVDDIDSLQKHLTKQ